MNIFFFIFIIAIPLQAFDSWLYDGSKSFEENCKQPYKEFTVPITRMPRSSHSINFLGYTIASPFGVAACAVTTSKGIREACKRGFSVLTYKTVRSEPCQSYEPPNLALVDCSEQISTRDIGGVFYAIDTPSSQPALSNSIGNACPDTEWVKKDIQKARQYLNARQVLVVSVFGDGDTLEQAAQDFAATAQLAWEAGAQVIELNLSCPNLHKQLLYKDAAIVKYIITRVKQEVPQLPLIIKVGVFDSVFQMRAVLKAAAAAGAQGICGINSVPVKIRTKENKPFFGEKREVSGLSGNPIRLLAQQFVKDATACIKEENLSLALLATGGAMNLEQLKEFLKLGAKVALCATAFMLSPDVLQDMRSKI